MTSRCNPLVREVAHASRAAGKDDHLSALAGTTDVQGHSVRRGNSQLIHAHNPAAKVVDCFRPSAQISAYGVMERS
jgi:hypothetical protein